MSFSDVSSATSHFSNANEGFTTTSSGTVTSGATVVGLNSVSGLTNGSIFVGVIEPGATKEQVFTGTVDTSGSRITGVVWTKGTNIDHAAGVTVVDYDTGTHHNLMKKGILVQHAQDGSHGVVTATSVTTPTLTVTSGSTLPAGDIITADLAADAVTAAKLADAAVFPANLTTGLSGSSWAWVSWTPTWANLTIGNAVQACKYIQVGKSVHFRVAVTLGNTSSVSSAPTFTLPVTSVASPSAFMVLGFGAYVQGTGAKDAICRWTTTTTSTLSWWDINSDLGDVTSTVPFTWANGDRIFLQGFYEAA